MSCKGMVHVRMQRQEHSGLSRGKIFLILLALAGLVLIGLGEGAEAIEGDQGWYQWLLTIGQRNLSMVAILMMLALATMISEDLTCIAAGLLAAQGVVGVGQAMAACFVGIWLGDMFMYGLGRFIGRPVLQRAPLKWILKPDLLEASGSWLHRVGLPAILLARFIPGSRNPVFVAAGALHLPFLRFCFGCALAAIIWVPFLTLLAMQVGGRALPYLDLWGQASGISIVLAALLVWLVARVVLPLFRLLGRRFPGDILSRAPAPVRRLFLAPAPRPAPPAQPSPGRFVAGGHRKRRKPRKGVPARLQFDPRRSARTVVSRLAAKRRRGYGGPTCGRSSRCSA